MAFWNMYPYTDFHELNLDWVLKVIGEMKTNIDKFISEFSNPVVVKEYSYINNPKKIYLYVGEDTEEPIDDYSWRVWRKNHWYYFSLDSESWVDGGLYGSAVVDDELDSDSVNAVQNKVITPILRKVENWKIVNVLDNGVVGDGVTDDTAKIQECIDNNPNSIIYFPKGEYKTSSPIITPCIYNKAVSILLDDFAIVKADENNFTADDYIFRLGGSYPYNNPYINGSQYGLTGGIIDGNGIANGISIDSGRETYIRNCNIKHIKQVGIYVRRPELQNSTDADISNINIDGMHQTNSIGLLIDGYDNTFANMRINAVWRGVVCNSSGNIFDKIHPLWIHDNYTNYETSIAFDVYNSNNTFNDCYSDGFSTGFSLHGYDCVISNPFIYWYNSGVNGMTPQVAINSGTWFDSIISNMVVEFYDTNSNNAVLLVDNINGGSGIIIGCRYTASKLNNSNDISSLFIERNNYYKWGETFNALGWYNGQMSDNGTKVRFLVPCPKNFHPKMKPVYHFNSSNFAIIAGTNWITTVPSSASALWYSDNLLTVELTFNSPIASGNSVACVRTVANFSVDVNS